MPSFNLMPIFVLAAIGATLGLWKAVEIVVWFCHHIHWN